jgi:hypothetical protein
MEQLPWLEAIDPDWDLLLMPNDQWNGLDVEDLLLAAFRATQRRSLGIAVVTKVLHIKRPRLIPVLDSLVLAQIGARASDDPRSWVAGVERVREVGRANLEALRAIDRHLRDRGIDPRSLVRILDALLWTSSSTAGLFSSLEGWERVLRPRPSQLSGT